MQQRYGLYLMVAVVAIGTFFLVTRQKSEKPVETTQTRESIPSPSQTPSQTKTAEEAVAPVATKKTESTRTPSQKASMSDREFSLPKDNKRAHNTGPSADEKLSATSLFPESRWKRWPGVRALPPQQASTNQEILAEVSGYSLTRDASFDGDEKSFSAQEPLVYYDSRTRSAGVVTGEIRLVVNDKQKLEQILDLYNLKVNTSLPDVHTYFVVSNEQNFNLEELYTKLARESQVESVQVEILSRQYEKF